MDLVSAAVPMVLRTGAARPLATIGCTSSPRGLAEVHVARTESCCLLGNFSAGRGHGRRNCGTTNHLSGWVELDGHDQRLALAAGRHGAREHLAGDAVVDAHGVAGPRAIGHAHGQAPRRARRPTCPCGPPSCSGTVLWPSNQAHPRKRPSEPARRSPSFALALVSGGTKGKKGSGHPAPPPREPAVGRAGGHRRLAEPGRPGRRRRRGGRGVARRFSVARRAPVGATGRPRRRRPRRRRAPRVRVAPGVS